MTEDEARDFVAGAVGPGALLSRDGGWVRVEYVEGVAGLTLLAGAKTYKEACRELLLHERVRQAALAGVVFAGTCLHS